MQPIELKIQGNFYDSQIYRGKLYLWHFDGRLSVYDWNQLIYNIDVPDYVAFVKELCLLDGSYLYKTYLYDRLLNDKEIKNKGDIYICHNKNCAYSFAFLDKEFDKYPEIIDYCQLFHATNTVKVNGENVNAAQLVVSDNFFEFLPLSI